MHTHRPHHAVRLIATLVTLAAVSVARADSALFFADWQLLLLDWTEGLPCAEQPPFPGDPAVEYTYIPHPGGGHDYPALHPRTMCTYDRLTAAGAVRAVMIRSRNCPFPYDTDGTTPSPETIDDVLGYVPDMAYVFMDLEGDTALHVAPNMTEVVARARAVNASVRVGNYAYFPGTYDGTWPYFNQPDRTHVHDAYLASGVDVAMPDCYPYSPYLRHALPNHYSGTAPNVRSALFWGPLERFSVAKRNLPPGHWLVPWVTPFIAEEGFDATPPTVRDIQALVQHLRLRGADALYCFSQGATMHPAFDAESYRQTVKAAWLALDSRFAAESPIEVLNVETNKTAGVEWSGIRSGDEVTILASNLAGSGPAAIELPKLPGLPATITVNNNEHRLLEFTLCPADVDQSGTVDFPDLLQVLASWGPCASSCLTDPSGNGSVDFEDLLLVLAAWGPCP